MAAENNVSDLVVMAGMVKDITVELLRSFGNNPIGLLIWCSAWVSVAAFIFMRGPARQMVTQLQSEVIAIKSEIHEIKSGQTELNDIVIDYQKERMAALGDIQNNLRHINDRIDQTYTNFADKERIAGLERSVAHFTEETTTILAQMREISRDSQIVRFLDNKKENLDNT